MYLYLFLVSVRSNTNLSEHKHVWSATTCSWLAWTGGVAVVRRLLQQLVGVDTPSLSSNITAVSNMYGSPSLSYLLCSQRTCLISMSLIFRVSNSTRDCLPLYASDSSYRLIILFLLFFLISFTSLFFFCFVSFIYLTPAALLICFFVVCGSWMKSTYIVYFIYLTYSCLLVCAISMCIFGNGSWPTN